MNLTKRLALFYLFAFLSCAGWFCYQLPKVMANIDFDLLSLLPKEQRNIYAEQALNKLSAQGQNAVILLVQGRDSTTTLSTAQALINQLQSAGLSTAHLQTNLDEFKKLYFAHRFGLITSADLATLTQISASCTTVKHEPNTKYTQHKNPSVYKVQDDSAQRTTQYFDHAAGCAEDATHQWYQRSLANAFSITGQALTWSDDPFGLFSNWLMQLGQITKFRPQENFLTYTAPDGWHYVLLQMTTTQSALAVSDAKTIGTRVEEVIKTLTKNHDVKILRSGVLFHTAYAAQQAEHDITTISIISTIGIVLLIMLVFGSLRGILLIALSIIVGIIFATTVTYLIFDKIYGLTLVFSTSLIGVAVDYGLIYLSTYTSHTQQQSRHLYLPMTFAMLTNVLAYATLLLTPFPIFSQIALFAIVGIITAALVVFLWFPYLAKNHFHFSFSLPSTRHLDYLKKNKSLLFTLTLIFGVGGLVSVKTNDDIRALVNLNPQLLREQIDITKIVDLPSPAQFFLVVDKTAEAALRTTETLTQALDKLVEQNSINGYEAVTHYLPSMHTQQTALALSKQLLYTNQTLLSQLAKDIPISTKQFAIAIEQNHYLTAQTWLSNPATRPLRFLLFKATDGHWISVVMLKGLTQTHLQEVVSIAHPKNVYWVDRTQQISEQMRYNRQLFTYLLILAYGLAALLAFAKWRAQSWRIVAPPILGSLLALAIFSMLGKEINMLTMAAFIFILGLGADYGIFLNTSNKQRPINIGVTLAMLTTLLSFGLLSTTQIPAISGFAFILAVGITFTWIFALILSLTGKEPDHV